MVLWAYLSANGAKGREIESPWKQKKMIIVFCVHYFKANPIVIVIVLFKGTTFLFQRVIPLI